ncbi:hypothetical protein M406DRAFT_68786 [Cryphonectria parasitica EP155]|uniref:Uncharacterized protein n=1 Tax=Cryphonectria parasitica (strain ATCC 38755 / EP155) TaxID=660469 RepID=A0A9P5CQP6_CRYP1|nr:uncharacterized protein M406DRAFT_68786 [Cryphonectria parasitica EP155]KAF3766446.1 hypothetical protein M406DRAFT_68786 [Cryphonectria parasitica EP155]
MNNTTKNNNNKKRSSTAAGGISNPKPAKQPRYDPYGDGKGARRMPRSRDKHQNYEYNRLAATTESLPRNTSELQWAYRVFGPGHSVISKLDQALFDLRDSNLPLAQTRRQEFQETLGLYGAAFYERVGQAYADYRAEIERVNEVEYEERMRAQEEEEKKAKEKERLKMAFETQDIIDLEALDRSPTHNNATQQVETDTGGQTSAANGQASSSIQEPVNIQASFSAQEPSNNVQQSQNIQGPCNSDHNTDKPGTDGHNSPARGEIQKKADDNETMDDGTENGKPDNGESHSDVNKKEQLIPDEYWMSQDEADDVLNETGIRIKKMNKMCKQITLVYNKDLKQLQKDGLDEKVDDIRGYLQSVSDFTGNTQVVMEMIAGEENWVWKRQRFNNKSIMTLIETIRELEKRVSDLLIELKVVAEMVQEWEGRQSSMKTGPAQKEFVEAFLAQVNKFIMVASSKATDFKSFVTMEHDLGQAEAEDKDGIDDGSEHEGDEDPGEGDDDEEEIKEVVEIDVEDEI